MSELIVIRQNAKSTRRQLLVTASAVALLGAVCAAGRASAESGSGGPTVWIELGGQLSKSNDKEEAFSPPIMADRAPGLSPSEPFERLPRYSVDETGKIAFEPGADGWLFSASVRFGRSNSNRDVNQGTHPKPFIEYVPSGTQTARIAFYPVASKFAETIVHNSEQHLIVDFQVGKDVGLGMFGGRGTSAVNLGVRYAQFRSSSNIVLNSDPDWHFTYKYLPNGIVLLHQAFHTNRANLEAERSFHGIGPSLSWNGSAPFIGNPQDGELSFDGGLNGAVLFGRQRVNVHHQSSGQYRPLEPGANAGPFYLTHPPTPVNRTRSHSVTVPNFGVSAGLSYRMENFKLSAGYRADFFFGAMDGGIDARKTYDRNFYGPFAAVSIGIGR